MNDPSYIERSEILRDKGTNRQQFIRGLVDKYTWVDVGGSYVPAEIASAFLFAQLEMLDSIKDRRREIFETYWNGLVGLEADGLLRCPRFTDGSRQNYHMFYVLLPDGPTRMALMDYLRSKGIAAVFHYIPLHSSPIGRKFGYQAEDLPVTEEMSARLLRLPFYCDMTSEDQAYVISHLESFLRRNRTTKVFAISQLDANGTTPNTDAGSSAIDGPRDVDALTT